MAQSDPEDLRLTTLDKNKLDTLIQLTSTGFRRGEIFIKKNSERSRQLEWLRGLVWEQDHACWSNGVRYRQAC